MVPECQHVYSHLETIKKTNSDGGYNIEYKRIDRFFCQKCLKERETVKSTYSRDKPDWF